ncbi:MAG: AAA family ATPase [Methanobacterium sp.]
MPHWKRAAVVGVPGVGKTSLCQVASLNVGCKHVNYGKVMLRIAQSKGLALTIPLIFQLDLEIQHFIWKEAALKIKEDEKSDQQEDHQFEKKVLLDLHGLDLVNKGYLVSLPFEILPPDIIIIIESSYDDILERRNFDSSKNRIVEDHYTIYNHMKMLRFSMNSISAILGCNLVILKNNDFRNCLNEMEIILRRKI